MGVREVVCELGVHPDCRLGVCVFRVYLFGRDVAVG